MLRSQRCPGISETVKCTCECSYSGYSGMCLCRCCKQSSLFLPLSKHTHTQIRSRILQALMHCSHTMKRWEGVGRWPLHCESFGLSSIQSFNSSVLIVPLSLYRDQSCTCPLMLRGQQRRLLCLHSSEIVEADR